MYLNTKKIFAIFLLFAVLITCAGVSFASSDFDDSNIDNIGSTFIDLDDDSDLDLDDDSDDDLDDDWDDEDYDDSDDDLDDDWEDDWDDEDYDDWDDDWDDEDYSNFGYWVDYNWQDWKYDNLDDEDYNFKYPIAYAYTTAKTMGFKYNRTNNQNESDNNTYEDNETEYFDYFEDGSFPIYYLCLASSDYSCPIAKGLDSKRFEDSFESMNLNDFEESFALSESQTNKTDLNNDTANSNVSQANNGSNILSLLALFIVCLLSII